MENYFLKNYITLEGAVPHNALYYQQLSIAYYQVSFLLTIILSNYKLCPVTLTDIQHFQNCWGEIYV